MADNNDDDENTAADNGESAIRVLFDAAEEILDPLNGLLERAKVEAGYPFRPEVTKALARLRGSDRPAFETLRARLKRIGIRVADLDGTIGELRDGRDDKETLPISADLTRSLEAMALFHSPDGRTFADIDVAGHRETIAVENKDFADRLTQAYFAANAEAPTSEQMRGALSLARARARYDGPEREVHVRVAAANDSYFLDLGGSDWRAVEITREGWRVISDPPVRFVRFAGSATIPEPRRGGSIELLRKHVNLPSDDDFVLAVGWLLSALRPTGPYPVLAVNGEQGSAKTTLSRCLRALVDPNAVPLRTLPKGVHDLMISATRAHVVAYDNLSRISSDMSDAFCRLCTGSGFAARSLYTDADETLLQAERPILLNGIDDIIARPDLAQRTIVLELKPIAPSGRRTVESVEKAFGTDRPFILGALLDAMVHGLRNLDKVSTATLPRMADAARWMVACEGAFWPSGTMMSALERSAREANDRLAERTPIVTAILELMRGTARWEGSASQLLPLLSRGVDEATRRSSVWPQAHARLGFMLKNSLRPLLRELGIEVEDKRVGHGRTRIITMTRVGTPELPPEPSASSEPGADHEST